jgi:N utilization substance protein A
MIIFDKETIRIINFIENITNANVKDCIIHDNSIYILVDKNSINKFSSYNISLINLLKKVIGKDIEIIPFSNDLREFLNFLIPHMISYRIVENGNKKILEIRVEKMFKGYIIGRNKKKLEIYRKIISRNFKINDIKIL